MSTAWPRYGASRHVAVPSLKKQKEFAEGSFGNHHVLIESVVVGPVYEMHSSASLQVATRRMAGW